DLATGAELFTHEPDKGLNLASNTKLLTSVAALGTLGAGFRWRTAVYVDDLDDKTGKVVGDLYLRGRGDPVLSANDLKQLAADVAARGVRSVEGQLVVDASYFDGVTEPPHYSEQPKERAAFRAPIAALGVARSAVTITVTGEPGGPGRVTLDPDAGDYVRVAKAEVKTITEGRTRLRIDAKPNADHLSIEVTGSIKVANGSYDTRKRVDDPAKFAAKVFEQALADQGVRIAKHAIGSAQVPPTAKLLAAHDSAALSTVMRAMNKESDNYIAESILKTLGAETRTTPAPATWADGVSAVALALGKLGLAPGSYRADNGSGLFDASTVSPHQLVTLLRAARKDYRIGPDLVASLPTGGVDGTLAKRWHDHAARGRVRAKTGTLNSVVSLAGFAGVDEAHPIAFAIVLNDVPQGQRGPARAMADDMVDAMIAYLEATH
ncbi:MAG TPA: D-alanyl-D-alanine carboxypeptidase/D-alanyl-D-alanine-endopeptidase, partial [Kofleriaceae bacterium]|nr:D-alanyl-D-alanine carboxypeptidase/D-alanyl-D-alanine-endopeptidase [Kofleriaceae bacterium]